MFGFSFSVIKQNKKQTRKPRIQKCLLKIYETLTIRVDVGTVSAVNVGTLGSAVNVGTLEMHIFTYQFIKIII